jgi:Mg2+/Co2+ transporter CorB
MVVLVLVVVATIFISSQCSLYEAVLYSTRMGTLEAERTDERRRLKARRMIEMKQKISIPLSAILILNTLANTAGATIAGMYAIRPWAPTSSPFFR